MKLADVPGGASVFLDANIFVYAFAPDPGYGPPRVDLLERVEHQQVEAVTSAHVLSDVAHRLMALEACTEFGWPYRGIANRLKKHPADVQKLFWFRQAIEQVVAIGVDVLPTPHHQVRHAAAVSQQYGLLSGDALAVAMMEAHSLNRIASTDADFDAVPNLVRYSP